MNGMSITVCAALLFLGCAQHEPFPTFTYHTIDNIGEFMGQTDLVDIDRDGDLDWVVGEAPHGGTSARVLVQQMPMHPASRPWPNAC